MVQVGDSSEKDVRMSWRVRCRAAGSLKEKRLGRSSEQNAPPAPRPALQTQARRAARATVLRRRPGAALKEDLERCCWDSRRVLSRVLVSQIRDGSVIAWKDYRHMFWPAYTRKSQGRRYSYIILFFFFKQNLFV